MIKVSLKSTSYIMLALSGSKCSDRKLLELLPAAVRELVINDEHLFAGLLLDASHPDVNQHMTIEHQTRIQIEAITRDYVYALHTSRTALVKVAES